MLYPEIDPVVIALGPIQVHWYGLMYLAAFAAGWLLGRYRARQPGSGWRAADVDELVVYAGFGVVLGGRLGYTLFYNLDSFLADPLMLLRIWQGGMSFHGGLLGVLVAMWLFARSRNKAFLAMTDFVAPLVPTGLLFGRLGNFINGELWGAPGNVPWAMQVPCQQFSDLCQRKLGLVEGTVLSPPLHPTQLYEAALEGLLLFVLLWWYSSRPRGLGAVSGLFLVLYAVFRMAVELVRIPDAHIGYLAGGWLTMGHLLSLPMLVLGLFLLLRARTVEAS